MAIHDSRFVEKVTPAYRVMLLYALALIGAELVTVFAPPTVGLVAHAGLIILLLCHAALTPVPTLRNLLLALVLAPLTRLVSLAAPLIYILPLFWYASIGLPLFLGVVLIVRNTGFSWADVGITGHGWLVQIFISLIALPLTGLHWLIVQPAPLIDGLTAGQLIVAVPILFIFSGLLEELIFRGLIQRAAVQYMGRLGIVYSAFIFTALYIGYRSLPYLAFVFVVALVFSVITYRTRSILGVAVAHGLMNVALFLLFPYLIAGH